MFGGASASDLRQALRSLTGSDLPAGLERALRYAIEPAQGDDLPARLAKHL